MIRIALFSLAATLCCCTSAAGAQQRIDDPDAPPPPTSTVEPSLPSVASRIGQRQERGEIVGIKPMAKVNSRFANRVSNRINNRVDRYYDSNRSTAAPFETAADQLRSADPRRRR